MVWLPMTAMDGPKEIVTPPINTGAGVTRLGLAVGSAAVLPALMIWLGLMVNV